MKVPELMQNGSGTAACHRVPPRTSAYLLYILLMIWNYICIQTHSSSGLRLYLLFGFAEASMDLETVSIIG